MSKKETWINSASQLGDVSDESFALASWFMSPVARKVHPAALLQGSGPVALDALAVVCSTALAFWLCYDSLPRGTLRTGATLALCFMVGLQLLLAGVLGVYREVDVRTTLLEFVRLTVCGLGSVLLAVQVIELGAFWGMDEVLSRPFVALTIALDVVGLALIRALRLAIRPRHGSRDAVSSA